MTTDKTVNSNGLICSNCSHSINLYGYPIKRIMYVVEGWHSIECQSDPSCKCEKPRMVRRMGESSKLGDEVRGLDK